MNISIAQYRAVIGAFNCVRFRSVHTVITVPLWMLLLSMAIIKCFIIVIILLQCNDVEVNPGPLHQKFNKLKICHANVRSLTRAKLKHSGQLNGNI